MREAYQHRVLALVLFIALWNWLPIALTTLWILLKVIILGAVSLLVSAGVLSWVNDRLEDD